MITIHESLWVIKGYKKDVEDSKFPLSYMTYVDLTKSGEKSRAFLNRIDTGTYWSNQKSGKGTMTFDNTPTKSVKIVGSVSRWSTSNKLIQVEDPRGFVIEIPTGNLTTLLKHTTVEKGVVKDECVWGREGNNHILLPTSSDVYKQAFESTQLNNTRVSLTKLNKGDVVKFSVDDQNEYIYLGRGKAVWDLQLKQAKLETRHWSYSSYRSDPTDNLVEGKPVRTITDSKLCFLFKCNKKAYSSMRDYEYKSSGQAIVIGNSDSYEDTVKFEVEFPTRCEPPFYKQSYYADKNFGLYHSVTTNKIIMK